jgi:hypothetical protein
MNPETLAKHIRDCLELHGYEIVLRTMAPRTEMQKRNQVERSEYVADQLLRRISVGEAV